MPDPCANRILSNSHGQLVAVDGKLAVGAACCGPAAPCNSVIFTPTVAHFICNGTVPVLLPCILIPLVKFGVNATYRDVPDLINLDGICYSKTACVQYTEDEAGTPPPFTCNGRLVYVYKTDQDVPYVALLTPAQIAAAECGVSKRVGIVAIKCDGFRLTENGLVSLWCPPTSCKFRRWPIGGICFSVNPDGPWRVRNPATDSNFHAAAELDQLPAVDDCCSCTPCHKDPIDISQPELGQCCCGTGNCNVIIQGRTEFYTDEGIRRVGQVWTWQGSGPITGSIVGTVEIRLYVIGGDQPSDFTFTQDIFLPWDGTCVPKDVEGGPGQYPNPEDTVISQTCPAFVFNGTSLGINGDGSTSFVSRRSTVTMQCDTGACGKYAGCSGAIVAVTGSIEGAV